MEADIVALCYEMSVDRSLKLVRS